MADTKISALTELAVEPSPDDLLAIVDDPGGTPTTKKITVSNLLARWRRIETSKYTATPATTSTITFSDTGDLEVGMPCRYAYGGTTYYGWITAISADTLVTIAGATLDTGQALTEFSVGHVANLVVVPFFVAGLYGDGAADLFLADMNAYFRWKMPPARLVAFEATHATADTGAAQPKINVKAGGSVISTADSNNGIQLSTAGTWVTNGAVSINTTNYAVSQNELIEVACTAAGTNGDAADLSGNLIFVLE